MKKFFLVLVIILSGAFSMSAQAVEPCPENTDPSLCQSFLMTLQGRNGQPPHPNDLRAVAEAIGGLVSQLQVENYFLIEKYPQGGFQACLDPAVGGGYDAAVYVFNTFRVGSTTSWDIVPVLRCKLESVE